MSAIRLHLLLRDYRDVIRADLRREYGIDLDAEMAERAMKPSVLTSLIRNLSRDALLWREMNPVNEWSQVEYLLAEIADRLGYIANGLGAKPEFQPIPRPGADVEDPDAEASTGFDTPEEFEAFYAAWKTRTTAGGPAG